jgi:misacylated tRNA(Ala) deacylase
MKFKRLYLEDPYIREFETTVAGVSAGKYVVLQETAFYPKSGGQPYDTGVLLNDGVEYRVVYVGVFDGMVSHEVDSTGLAVGDRVHGMMDWDRRHTFMRSHTAGHILSAVVHRETGAEITGNQLGVDYSRIDFNMEDFDREMIKEFEGMANEAISRELPVEVRVMPRQEAMKIPSVFRLAKGFPAGINEIRVVDIGGVDAQACGGTHVKNTREIGLIQVFKAENKGRNNRRMYYMVGK